MYPNAQNAYQQTSVNTAKPEELTLMLYNGLVKFIRLSRKSLQENNISATNTYNQKAQNIVKELMSTLKPEFALYQNFYSLYDFCLQSLIQGNIKKDDGKLAEAEELSVEFRDMWISIMKVKK